MLDNILNLIKETVTQSIGKNKDVPEEKKVQAVNVTTQALTSGLKENLHLGNLSHLTSLFKEGSSVEKNPVTHNIIGTVTRSLIQRIALSPTIAGLIANSVVPLVMKVISGKVNDKNEKGFNVESLIQTFAGKSKEGIMGKIGKLFS